MPVKQNEMEALRASINIHQQHTTNGLNLLLFMGDTLEKCLSHCGGCRNEEKFDENGNHTTPHGPMPCSAPGAKKALDAFEELKHSILSGE